MLGVPTTRSFSSFIFASRNLRDQVFENLLPDIAAEVLANQRHGRFSRAETLELSPFSELFRDRARFLLDCVTRDRDFKLVLATFN